MQSVGSTTQALFKSALAIFVVTIVIGILNGMGVWDPPHELVMTHVHAGTLGWITLAVVGVLLRMFARPDDGPGAGRLGLAVIVSTVVYVIAFAATTGTFRPIAGTLMLAAIIWVLVWVSARYRSSERTAAHLAMFLATVSLAVGAVLGVLLGLFIALGEIPGLGIETAQAIAGAHPPAMLAGYLAVASLGIVYWLFAGGAGILARVVVWALFVAGMLFNIAFILDQEMLIQVASLLQVLGIVAFVVVMWSVVAPKAWGGPDDLGRLGVAYLVLAVGLLVYVVQLFVSGQLVPETGEGPIRVLIAFDHALFIGVMSNVLFGVVARMVEGVSHRPIMWGVNLGLVVFLVGLLADNDTIIAIGAPVMGLALLYGIARFLMAPWRTPAVS